MKGGALHKCTTFHMSKALKELSKQPAEKFVQVAICRCEKLLMLPLKLIFDGDAPRLKTSKFVRFYNRRSSGLAAAFALFDKHGLIMI